MPSATGRSASRPRQPCHAGRQGLTKDVLETLEKSLASAFDIKFVFNKWTLGQEFLTDTLKVPAEKLEDPPSSCCPSSASPRERSSWRTSMSAAR